MDYIGSLLKIIDSSLRLMELKESHKYKDEWLSLNQAYHDEVIKDEEHQDFSLLDRIEHRIKLLVCAIGNELGKQDTENKP
jgi:hypothetical protein